MRLSLDIQILVGEQRKVAGFEQVCPADLSDVIHETWRDCRLRKGLLESSPEDLPIKILLIGDEESTRACKGFALILPGKDETETSHSVFLHAQPQFCGGPRRSASSG